jgi:hypothetical protein
MASPPQAISNYFTLLREIITTEAEIQEKFKQTAERRKYAEFAWIKI